jgi:AcrR family transcriptional regulator
VPETSDVRAPLLTPANDPSEEARGRLIEATIAELRRKPFHEVSLESVAASADLRRGQVTQHFPTWQSLIEAVVASWNHNRMTPLLSIGARSGAVRLLRAITISNASDPALMRVLVAAVNIAASPDQPLARRLRDQFNGFYELVEATLAHDIEVGREPATMDPARGAEQLIALYEGLQIQSLVRPDMDLVAAFDRAITRLRRGWADVYLPPAWDASA